MIQRLNYKELSPVLFLIILFLISCEERYWPPDDIKYDNVLVIDGMITNAPGPYTIKLSSSVEINSYRKYIPVSGYQLVISDDEGNSEALSETETGVYETAINGIQGILGRSYQLSLISPNGKTYLSNFEKLNDLAGIDSLYSRLEYKNDPEYNFTIEGYQFYLDSELSEKDSVYFLWSLTSTYKYRADMIIRWIYDGSLRPFTAFDSLRTCWITETVPNIYLFDTEDMSESKVIEFPLHYVSTLTRDLSIRYSLLVEQYTISKAAHTFWSDIEEQNSEAGELHTTLPFQIRGNIFNPDNPNELILGYFMAAGIDTKRIFVNRPLPPTNMRYPICTLSESDYMNFGTIFMSDERDWPIYATFDNDGYNALPPDQSCVNCELNGGTIVEPDFWEEE